MRHLNEINLKLLGILLLSIFGVLTVGAQELTVKSFNPAPFDLAAASKPVIDYNGVACGLVKVRLASEGAEFEGNVMQPVEFKAGEYWVYMTKGSYKLKIKHPKFIPLDISFRDYGVRGVESNCTYELTLLMPNNSNSSENLRYLVVKVQPANATLFVDDNLQAINNGTAAIRLPKGTHTYRVDALGYETQRGSVELTEGKKTLNIVLTPSANQSAASTGSLDVSYQPIEAEVWLDGKRLGTSPDIFHNIAAGTHNVEIRSNGMQTARHTVNIVSGETAQLSGTLTASNAITSSSNAITSSSNAITPSSNAIMPVPEAVDLGLSVKWASFNLGASKPEEYGNYYAWGETEPKKEYTQANYKYAKGKWDKLTKYCTKSKYGYNGFTDGKTTLEPEDDAATVNLGGKWRMPTIGEIRELKKKCKLERTSVNGVKGVLVTGPNGNTIFLPAAGWYNSYGQYFHDDYNDMEYWQNTITVSSTNIFPLHFEKNIMRSHGDWCLFRSSGLPIRPVLAE